jgi:hypothetical protein
MEATHPAILEQQAKDKAQNAKSKIKKDDNIRQKSTKSWKCTKQDESDVEDDDQQVQKKKKRKGKGKRVGLSTAQGLIAAHFYRQ